MKFSCFFVVPTKEIFSDFNCSARPKLVKEFFLVACNLFANMSSHPQAHISRKTMSRMVCRISAQIWFIIAKIYRLGINKKPEFIQYKNLLVLSICIV